VEHGLRSVFRLDDDIRLGEAPLDVAALVALGLVVELSPANGFVRIEQRLELLPLHVDELDRGLRLLEGVGCDGRDESALKAGLAREHIEVVRPEHSADPGRFRRPGEVDLLDARVRVWAAERRHVQHPRKLDVRRVPRLAGRALVAVDFRGRAADHLARACGPRRDRVFFDHDPLFRVVAFDFLLGTDQSRHVRIASSILGYAPQRQRLPAIACRISSRVGWGVASTSAAAETICPGVQKPHWNASLRTNDVTRAWSRSPSIVVISRPTTV
jgi:hypothetical protein